MSPRCLHGPGSARVTRTVLSAERPRRLDETQRARDLPHRTSVCVRVRIPRYAALFSRIPRGLYDETTRTKNKTTMRSTGGRSSGRRDAARGHSLVGRTVTKAPREMYEIEKRTNRETAATRHASNARRSLEKKKKRRRDLGCIRFVAVAAECGSPSCAT